MYRRIKECYPGQTLGSKKEAKCDPVSGIRFAMGMKKPPRIESIQGGLWWLVGL